MSELSLPSWYDPSRDDGSPNQAPHARAAIARQLDRVRGDLQAQLQTPNTGTPYLTRALKKYLPSMLLSDGVAVPDDPEEMRWRLFFAHSQDMMGFRADIFTGGPNEEKNPYYPAYQGLRDRWPDSTTMLQGLAALWQNDTTRQQIIEFSNPFRSKELKASGMQPAMELLRGSHGNAATRVFADALDDLKGHKIAHKTNAIVRAYCQNAAVLAPHDYCFRTYLLSIVPNFSLPMEDVTVAEAKWRSQILRDFYHVGPALAPYLIADWLFGLWRDGQIEWFDSYKADSVWLKTLANGTSSHEAVLPPEAVASPEAFVAYCKTLRLPPEWIPAHLWHLAFYGLPPRVVNEVIWLEEAATGEQLKSALALSPKPEVTQPESEVTDEDPDDPYTLVPLMEPAQEQTDGTLRVIPHLIWYDDTPYLIAFTSMEEAHLYLGDGGFPRLKQQMSATVSLFTSVMRSDLRIAGIVFDPAGQHSYLKTRQELPQTLVQTEMTKTEDILHMAPLSQAASPTMLAALARVLKSAGITEARGVWITYTDMRQTWLLAIPSDDPTIFSAVWHGAQRELRHLVDSDDAVPDVALCDLRTSSLAADFGEHLNLKGEIQEAEMSEAANSDFITATGRLVTLARLVMMPTYDGQLEGTAETISKYLREAMHEAVINFLPPTQAWVVLDDGEKQLPPLQWFAVFHSRNAVHTRDADYSSRLGICWFTNTLPESLTAMLQNVVARVDYEARAEDYDIMP